MKKKKVLVLFLSVVMTAVLFSACGSMKESDSECGRMSRSDTNAGAMYTNSAPAQQKGYTDGGASYVSGASAEISEANTSYNNTTTMDAGDSISNMPMESYDGMYVEGEAKNWNTEEYNAIEESGFKSVKNDPFSTFSVDVDTASYSNLRRMIKTGSSLEDIPSGAVRIEEMLNYFSYDYKLPEKNEPFGVTTVLGDCPWNEDAKLLQIGLKTQNIDFSEAPPSNLVFLIDVSGSMYSNDKLPLLQKSFSMLINELTEKDTISIVTYAGSDEVILEGEPGNNKTEIIEALSTLEAGGSTNGVDGIKTAYKLAEKYFIEGGNNRIILATDGDLNVGVSSESELKKLVTKERKSGVFLSVLGFGTGNIKDNKMEALADNGNGNYAYIDSVSEAKKVLVDEMGATLVTVAKDVKLQVEFNPAYVKGYRLLGYENRALATEDFDDDKKDAGEIGAGHMVTALYEIIPVDSEQDIPDMDMKYQNNDGNKGVENGEWLNLKIRYKEPDADESILKEYPVTEDCYMKEASQDFYFAAAVAEFGLILRDSEYKGEASFEAVRELLKNIDTDSDDYKQEFVYLVKELQNNSFAD